MFYTFQLATALRSGNPEEYVSHLPVHQDGSCNGLQHYAALGRDKIGAISVNLAPSKAPQVTNYIQIYQFMLEHDWIKRADRKWVFLGK